MTSNTKIKLTIPAHTRAELSEIFTEKYMPAVERACTRYLSESQQQRPSVVDDGRTLAVISEKARELRQLLKQSEAALERVQLHMSEEFKKHDTFSLIDDLKKKLKVLDEMCFVNPARDRAENPKKGRPKGSVNEAERALAFNLWEIYRTAHGHAPARVYAADRESGPLPDAATILGPILGLGSNMARHFRQITEDLKSLDIK